jgi:hypothetical protein
MKYFIFSLISLTLAVSSPVHAADFKKDISSTSSTSISSNLEQDTALNKDLPSSNPENSTTSTSTITIKSESKAESCEIKAKLNQRKDRLNLQIQKQLTDKNKLVSGLIVLASSSESKTKELIQDSVIQLDAEVLDLIKSQKEIISIIASTTETSCTSTTKLKRENDRAQIRIKKISVEIEKKSTQINSFIKNDLRALIEKIEE